MKPPPRAQPRIANRLEAISPEAGTPWRGNVASMETNAGAHFRVALHRAMGCYLARVLELPGCVGRGATEVEAVEMARTAIRAHLAMARALEGDSAMVQLEIRV